MNDVELLVNNNDDVRRYVRRRTEARRRKHQLQKQALCIAGFAVTAGCMVLLGSIGAIPSILAAFVSAVTAMATCFTLGLLVATLIRN